MSRDRQRLIEEISFWRELMNESALSVTSLEYQRMRNALQFAEFRLASHERGRVLFAGEELLH